MEEQEPTNMKIKTNKSAHDDRSCSTMTASIDGGRIPRKKLLRENYCARSESYINAMKEMFMQITQNVEIALTSREKPPKLLIDIGGGWYMEKVIGDYHH